MLRRSFGCYVAAFALFAAPLAAQNGTLAGRVSDAETGAPLRDAAIEVLGTGDAQAGGVFSDATGTFRVQVPAGSYSVVISLLGFETVRLDGISVDAGQVTDVAVDLSSTAFILNPIVVSASRREEKSLDAPARVEIVGAEAIQSRAATTAVEHVKNIPGVDIAQSGLSQSNVVARGFNNIFSGSLLVLTDNRYGSVPSLRVNAWNFIPLNNLDMERMEVVLGPGAALYGPNSASGVLHMITASPLDRPGTTVAVAGGERSVLQGQFRTAWSNDDNFGFKLSGQYFQGNDWEYEDPVEVAARDAALMAGANPTGLQIGNRDFEQKRYSLDGRMDFRLADDAEWIFNAGFNQAVSSIELTGIGAGQADNWGYQYAQTRFTKGRLFAQAFVNASDAGDTYLLRTGQPIVDQSKFYAAQIQHGIEVGERQQFTYGLDLQWTRPETGGTINGRNEDDDSINEVGGYLHSETALSDKVDIVAALRVDNHSHLEDLVFSPRAALVFRPQENQNFRFTFNRAFSTPTSNNLFLDILAGQIPIFGNIGYDIRARGTPDSGFTFDQQCAGGVNSLCMRSPFAPGMQLPANGAALFNSLIPQIVQLAALQDPSLAPLVPTLTQLLTAGDPTAAIGTTLLRLNTEDQSFSPDPGPSTISRLKPTITNTIELGYKGIIEERFLLAADLYRTKVNDFVGPLRVETPLVFMNGQDAGAYIGAQLAPLVQSGTLPASAVQALATALATQLAMIPVGTVVPDQFDSSDLLVAYRNFGDVSFWGADLSAQLLVGDRVSLNGTFSFVSDDCFDANEDGTVDCTTPLDIALNAPKTKGSLGFRFDDERSGFGFDGRARFTAGFPVNSGVFMGELEGYTVFDANVSYQLPFYPGATVGLTANNLFDNAHRQFIGAPLLGRLLLLRTQIDL